MKLTQSLALLVVAAFTIPFALANFYVLKPVNPHQAVFSCPANYHNCECMDDGSRNEPILVNGRLAFDLPDSFFSIQAGLCGMGQLNFYKQGDGHWEIYVDQGDGSVQGECSSKAADRTSCFNQYDDKLICTSYICGN